MILSRAGILSNNLAQEIATAIEMRKLLVHGYADLNYSKLYEATRDHAQRTSSREHGHASVLTNELEYFDEFAVHITRYLQRMEERAAKCKKKR